MMGQSFLYILLMMSLMAMGPPLWAQYEDEEDYYEEEDYPPDRFQPPSYVNEEDNRDSDVERRRPPSGPPASIRERRPPPQRGEGGGPRGAADNAFGQTRSGEVRFQIVEDPDSLPPPRWPRPKDRSLNYQQ